LACTATSICLVPSIGQHVHALFQAAGQPVEFPDNNGVNLTGKDGGLQFWKRFALEVRCAVAVFEPLDGFLPVAFQPCLKLGSLAVGLLAFRGRYADIDGGGQAKLGTPYFAGCPRLRKLPPDAGFKSQKNTPPYFAEWLLNLSKVRPAGQAEALYKPGVENQLSTKYCIL
jgi:hypothetical protein